jgi:hypothetical protein
MTFVFATGVTAGSADLVFFLKKRFTKGIFLVAVSCGRVSVFGFSCFLSLR